MSHNLRRKIHKQKPIFQESALWVIRLVEAAAVLLPLFWAIEAAAMNSFSTDFFEEYFGYIATLEPQSVPSRLASREFQGERDVAQLKHHPMKPKSSFVKNLIPHWYFGQMSLKPGLERRIEDKGGFKTEQLRAQENVYFEKNTSPTFRSDPAMLPTAAVLLSF